MREKQRDGAIEDGAGIPIRDVAAEERLKLRKLLVGRLSERELHAVTLRSRRPDDGSR